jgi:Secretion system C-terminal sorting domain
LEFLYNQIETIDLTGLTNLNYLGCSYNVLTSLDVSSLTNLLLLDCIDNRLNFFALQKGLIVNKFIYIPQDTLFETQSFSTNTTVDYSSGAIIYGSTTNFDFLRDGELVESNTTGIFTTNGSGKYCCNMINSKFPGLTLATGSIIISGVTAINNIDASDFFVFPNPAINTINFKSSEKIEHASIFSLNGIELMNTKDVTKGIDVSMLSKGLYLLKVYQMGTIQIQKLMVK